MIGRLQAACPPDVAVLGSDALAHVPVGVRRGDAEGRPGVLAERVVRAPGRRRRSTPWSSTAARRSWFGTAADLHHMGGAFGRVPEDATAFPNRSAAVLAEHLRLLAGRLRDDAARIAWVKGFSDADAAARHGRRSTSTSWGTTTTDAHRKALAVYGPAKLRSARWRSSAATTRRTCSGSTTTSRPTSDVGRSAAPTSSRSPPRPRRPAPGCSSASCRARSRPPWSPSRSTSTAT